MNTFFLITLILVATFAEPHTRTVGNLEKQVTVTPDRVGIDENVALN